MQSLTALFTRTFLLLRDFAARFARLREANGYGLLAALNALAAAAAAKFAALHFVHRALYLAASFSAISSCHSVLGHRIATLDKPNKHQDDRNDEKNVDKASDGIGGNEPQEP